MGSPSRLLGFLLLCSAAVPTGEPLGAAEPRAPEAPFYYRPKLRVPEALEPYLKEVEPGGDSFPEEKEAAELGARLRELGAKLRLGPRGAEEAARLLLARRTRAHPEARAQGASRLP